MALSALKSARHSFNARLNIAAAIVARLVLTVCLQVHFAQDFEPPCSWRSFVIAVMNLFFE